MKRSDLAVIRIHRGRSARRGPWPWRPVVRILGGAGVAILAMKVGTAPGVNGAAVLAPSSAGPAQGAATPSPDPATAVAGTSTAAVATYPAHLATATAWPTNAVATNRAEATRAAADATAAVPGATLTRGAIWRTATAKASGQTPISSTGEATAAANHRRITASCGTDNPYFVTAYHVRDRAAAGAEPAIVAFNDHTPSDLAAHIPLALQADIGTIYGLAYDWRRGQLYAAAHRKIDSPLGFGGSGAIYQIDLQTSRLRLWAALDAGPQGSSAFASGGSWWVGRSSLGDIDLSEDGSMLFAVNLYDRRIHRLSVPDGQAMGTVAHGAALEPWSASARPFGLKVDGPWLLHGVVDTRELGGSEAPGGARVYRSAWDGTTMTEVMHLDLRYRDQRSLRPWGPWHDSIRHRSHAQPLISDIEVRHNGDLLISLRDREGDTGRVGNGDLLLAVADGSRWHAVTRPGHFADTGFAHWASLNGALALFPGRDWVLSTAHGAEFHGLGAVAWFDSRSGRVQRVETIYDSLLRGASQDLLHYKSQAMGDLEPLCEVTDPPPIRHVYLPVALSERCTDRQRRADIVLVMDASSSMLRRTASGRTKLAAAQSAARLFVERLTLERGAPFGTDQVALVGFNDRAWREIQLTDDRAAFRRALDSLAERVAEGTRLDLALDEGTRALTGPGRRPGNTAVLIVLTDGLPNRVPTPATGGSPDDTVLSAAQRAKSAGVAVYAIGVGLPDAADPVDRINGALLARIASSIGHFFQTPDADDLGRIYDQVAASIGCPPGRHDWGQPWP